MWFIAILLTTLMAGCGGGSGTILGSIDIASSTKVIAAFSFVEFPANPGVINEPAKTIEVNVPFGANPAALVATYISSGTAVTVATAPQVSSTTPNNFTAPVVYTVSAIDGTTAAYTVTVTILPSTLKTITAFSLVGFPANAGVINEPAKTIAVNLPFGTNPAALVATYTTTGTGVKVAVVPQVSGITPNNFTAPLVYTVTAGDTTTADYTLTVTFALNPAKAISAYSFLGFPANPGVVNEPAKTIAVTVPFGTNTAAMVAIFTTTGISAKVGATVQTSSATINSYTAPVVYTVMAADGTTVDYTVTVTAALNPAKALTAYSFVGFPANPGVVNEPAKTIAVTVPFGTNVTSLTATFTTTGVKATVGAAVQTSTATANNFTAPVVYKVTAADATTLNYTVTVTAALNPAKAITAYSFVGFPANTGVVNEPAKTIAVTVPFGTNVTALVARFTTTGVNARVGAAVQTSTATANNFSAPVVYTVTAADATTLNYTVIVTAALNPAKAITAYSFVGFTANPGVVNEIAKTIAVTVPFGTNVTAMTSTFTTTGVNVKVGAVVQTSTATANNFNVPVVYTVTAADATTVNYTVTVTAALNPAKAFTAYSFVGFPANPGVVNEPAKTISVTVPFGTNVTALVAIFTTTGVNETIGAVDQTSTATANNFSAPVIYTVTAADSTTVNYTVIVTAALNPAKAFTAYSFVGFPANPGVVNEPAKTISVTVPFGTNVTALVAIFTTTGVNETVGAVDQTSTATANNFSAPVVYKVTAADASSVNYTVTVKAALNPAKAITAYSFVGYPANTGVINESAKTIAVTVPIGTNLTPLVATFTTTGLNVAVGAAVQTSTSTANNFSAPVVYTVTAADATTVNYTVTVTAALNPAKALTAYSFVGYPANRGVINEPAKTISVTVPFGTNVTALAATFTTTGTNVSVGAAVQTSTATANNFNVPVVYTVTAADASTVNYTVTVTVALNPAKAITAYSFAGFSNSNGIINELANPKTIAVGVPSGTNLATLVATYTSTGVSESVLATGIQTSDATLNDFSVSPVPYIVTAADLTTATYNVTVTPGSGPAPVLLGTAGNFVILSQAASTDVPSSAITGNVGASPISGTSILVGGTCAEVTGIIYSVDAAGPPCSVFNSAAILTPAVGSMVAAYNDGAGRVAGVGPFLNAGLGILTNQNLAPGLYTWNAATSNLTIPTNLTLTGGANDVWIFQVAGTLNISTNMNMILVGTPGNLPQAKNIFWVVAGAVTLNPGSHFEGVILGASNIAMQTGASINGRLLSQTGITLQSNIVTQPAP